MYKSECLFCQLNKKDEFDEVLFYGAYGLLVVPLNPVVPGHIMYVTKGHYDNFTVSPDLNMFAYKEAVTYAEKHIPGDMNLITSKGSAATQTQFHLHFHFVPRTNDDGLTLPWTGQASL